MKVAVLSESPADEAAIRVLIEGLLDARIELFAGTRFMRAGDHGAVFKVLPSILKHLHYRTDVEGLVVVVDSDRSAVHQETHDRLGHSDEKCRLCRMRMNVRDVLNQLSERTAYGPLRTALGLAVPQIEAWYLVGCDPQVGEAAWSVRQQSGKLPYTSNSLKQSVYDTDRPSLALETQRATQHAQRIVQEGKLPQLSQLFPGGFGALANDLRSW